MKKGLALFFWIGFVFFLSSCSTNNTEQNYDSGYEAGYSVAVEEYQSFVDSAFSDGYEKGYADGELNGYDNGHEDGYSEGEYSGYYDGITTTYLVLGEVDKAFQSASIGISWYAFLDAYDQHVQNIFDDEDSREELWGALDAAVYGNPSKQEQELLIITFGSEFFSRNGITFRS